jgi:hypothetical protein
MDEADDALLAPLGLLVVKHGVGLGGLPLAQQAAVWALAWAGLPDSVMNERQVNEHLKGLLAGAASFIDTDHVELRRWLVDAGWLQRDGYGREYRRTPAAALPDAGRPLAERLTAIDAVAWAAAQRAHAAARREARRRDWEQGAGPR